MCVSAHFDRQYAHKSTNTILFLTKLCIRVLFLSSKSTLIRILGGMLRPDRGELKLKLGNDKLYPINSFQPKLLIEMRVKFIGYVLQPPILLQDQTALQNVEFPMILAGHRRNVRLNEATQLLSAVGLADRIHMPAGQLSKSEQQRVAIAQAFANNPPIVFLDDPTNNLTHAETVHIMDFLIAKNRSNPPTAIFMTCNNVLLHCYADRVLNMENGHFHKHELHYVQRKLDKAKYIAHMTNATPRT